MRVYLVNNEDGHVVKVFTTREQAKKYIQKRIKEELKNGLYIQEMDVSTPYENLRIDNYDFF